MRRPNRMQTGPDGAPRCRRCNALAIRRTLRLGSRTWSPWVLPCSCDLDIQRQDDRIELVRRMAVSGVPRLYSNMVLRKAIDRDLVHPAAREMAARPGRGPGLFLLGKTGAGKTFSGLFVIQSWLEAGVRGCRYAHLPTIATEKTRNEIADELALSRLVQVDDIGYQKHNEDTAKWLFALVDKLHRNDVPVVYTTSFHRKQIAESVGGSRMAAAVLDRLNTCRTVEWKDRGSMRKQPGSGRRAKNEQGDR